jgi:hypothetical protein
MTTTPTTTPPQLDYGLAPPRKQKRILRIVIVGVVLLLGAASWKWGTLVWNRAPMLFWQRQCMRYTASPDEVVYEEDPVEAQKLLSRGYVRYKLTRGGSPDPTPADPLFAAAAPHPNCWKRLNAVANVRAPVMGNVAGLGSGAIIFLHERTTPQGTRRLVCIRYFAETYSFSAAFIEGYNTEHNVITPGDWTTMPAAKVRALSVLSVLSGFPRHPPRVRVFAGQVDPDDSACFTIRYQMWGKEDVLDGRLREPGYITLTPRNPPKDER